MCLEHRGLGPITQDSFEFVKIPRVELKHKGLQSCDKTFEFAGVTWNEEDAEVFSF